MAFQKVPETARIELVYSQGGRIYQNNLHARLVGGYAESDLITLAGIVDNRIGLSILPIQSPNVTYEETVVRGLDQENDLVVSDNSSQGDGGSIVDGVPPNVTKAITLRSGLTGRSARGRIYWIGANENDLDQDEGFFLAASVNIWVGLVDLLRTDIGASAWTPVIVSRRTGGVQRPEGVTFTWQSTSNFTNNVNSQRGRLP